MPGAAVFVAMSSYWGRSTASGVAPYNATKFAIEGLVGGLAKDLVRAAGGGRGGGGGGGGGGSVAAVAVNPGVIHTEMLEVAFGAAQARRNPSPEEWVQFAAPFLLGLGARDNGASLTVPNF